MKDIQDVFGNFPVARFIAEHLHRLPLALANACPSVGQIGTWETVGEVLATPEVDVLVVKPGERYDGPAPTDLASAQALAARGCTIRIRHAERRHAAIAELAELFAATFQGPVDVQLYATPPGCASLSWHYDAEDVFILQSRGEKAYELRKNTVNPWPLEETLPSDMQYERELMPLMRVLLGAGDLLYIPCGYWHRAQATPGDERSISLSVGVMSRSAMDIFDLLRDEALRSLVWRQRLPIKCEADGASPEDWQQKYHYLFDELAADLSRTIKSREFREMVQASLSGPPALRTILTEGSN